MSKIIDVTEQVDFGWNDDELLPINKCVCGYKFKPWTFIIGVYEEDPYECPKCGAKLFFRTFIKVYEIVD